MLKDMKLTPAPCVSTVYCHFGNHSKKISAIPLINVFMFDEAFGRR